MTMAMRAVQVVPPTGPKVLRVGIIQAGRIVEERIIRARETVSIGTSEKNHFIVASDALPSRFEVFQLVGNDYILNFTDQMSGRVGLPGGVQSLDQLRKSGGARNAGSHWQVKLSDSSRGKITIGTTTVLFQFVSPPPIQPRPQLPAAARGGFVKSIDWLFTAFVVFSYMVFFGLVVYLESADWPIDQGISAVPENLTELMYEEPEEEPPKDETPTDEPAKEEPSKTAEDSKGKAEDPGPSDSPDKGPSESDVKEASARIAEDAAAQVETMLMGSIGEGALADVLAGGADTTGAADVLAQAAGVGVAQGGAGTLRDRGGGGGSGRGNGLGGLAAAGGGTNAVGTGEVREVIVRGNVNFDAGDETGGSGDFDQSEVSKLIKGSQSALKRCYETELKSNPGLSGKVEIEFTIEQTGSVSKANVSENTSGSAGLGSCVAAAIKRLRWRKGPDGGSVTYRYPFVFQPQR
jgi:TonB family protein